MFRQQVTETPEQSYGDIEVTELGWMDAFRTWLKEELDAEFAGKVAKITALDRCYKPES